MFLMCKLLIHRFYEGLVKSYDHQKKRHVVLYNDGDVEVLRLDKERWELVSKSSKPTKRNRLSKSPRSKGGSSKKNIKSLDNAKKKYEGLIDISPSSMVRGKRTPRKNLKQKQKGVFRRTLEYSEAERKEDPDMSEPEPEPESEPEHEHTTFSKVDNLDTEEEASDKEGGNSAGEQESDEEKQNKHAENSFSDGDSKEIEPDSGQKETENVERSGSDEGEEGEEEEEEEEEEKESPSATRENSTEEANRSGLGCKEDDGESQPTDHDRKSSDSDEAEFSDDMPLVPISIFS
ncbi:hypothetical protein L6452_31341 [Arctium lappa]|uniref:Uncharacterized protein n=1 Tax=Arctium lappa TaxID=4217 RepID=A0ACB8ZKW6_ARCLA|nr:hypothetical protein L6452_31341 [Arctium lappa]